MDTEKTVADNEVIAELQAQISRMKEDMQELADKITAYRASESAANKKFAYIEAALAIDCVVQRTHSERNAVIRSIVRMIDNHLNEDGLGVDDIPF